ncbi:MAG: site-specific integrase [Candidatus Pacebacteria bacterium]|nr:site-specific integrase [Candidatus Paceibacterota bacterium]
MTQNKTRIQSLVHQFLEYVEIEKGRSLKTVDNYQRYLYRFLDFANITEPQEITDDLVREFRLHLNRQMGARTKGQHTSTLKKKNTKLLPHCAP